MIPSVIKTLPGISPEQVLASCFGILKCQVALSFGNVQPFSLKPFIRSKVLKFDEEMRVNTGLQ